MVPTPAGGGGAARIIGASSLGTLFEWYDFYLYGALAGSFASHFFSGVNETTSFLLALATFAVGFIVRPLGALLFGRIGDRAGRKVSFIATLAIMGVSTFLVGVLPDYGAIGLAAPLLLVALRVLQGLAIGGEFGGAIVYVAEHAPAGRRALHTSFIPAMALAGLLLSLAVITATRASMSPDDFDAWGWRLPFLLSVVLLAISLWVRLRLEESPVFRRLQQERAISRTPVAEALGRWENLRHVLAALFGAVAGQAVIFYVSTFYAYYFLERVARVDGLTTAMLTAVAVAIGAPLVVLGGHAADRFGRKPLLLAATALAALGYFPLFGALLAAANPGLAEARRASPVVVEARAEDCSLQFDPVGRRSFDARSCDIVKSFLAKAGVGYEMREPESAGPARLFVGDVGLEPRDTAALPAEGRREASLDFAARAAAVLAAAGYAPADRARIDRPRVVAILVALLALAALASGAYAALLAELFPARIRYTALSFPQNFGNGWFGGLLPAIAFTIVAATGDVFAGLWYPVSVSALAFLVCAFALPETRGRSVD